MLGYSERERLVSAFFQSMDEGTAERIALDVLGDEGAPWPALFDLVGAATLRASAASRREREVYAVVSFLSLPRDRRLAFARRVGEEVAR